MARRAFFASLFGLLVFTGFLSPSTSRGQAPAWFDGVAPLITAREREAFLRLANDADRQAFIQRFWEVRDPYPETPRNEAKERWEARNQ